MVWDKKQGKRRVSFGEKQLRELSLQQVIVSNHRRRHPQTPELFLLARRIPAVVRVQGAGHVLDALPPRVRERKGDPLLQGNIDLGAGRRRGRAHMQAACAAPLVRSRGDPEGSPGGLPEDRGGARRDNAILT